MELELENSNDPPVILSGKMTLSLIPDRAHGSDDEGHTGRDSGQESEQEDGHDSNSVEPKGEYDKATEVSRAVAFHFEAFLTNLGVISENY